MTINKESESISVHVLLSVKHVLSPFLLPLQSSLQAENLDSSPMFRVGLLNSTKVHYKPGHTKSVFLMFNYYGESFQIQKHQCVTNEFTNNDYSYSLMGAPFISIIFMYFNRMF